MTKLEALDEKMTALAKQRDDYAGRLLTMQVREELMESRAKAAEAMRDLYKADCEALEKENAQLKDWAGAMVRVSSV